MDCSSKHEAPGPSLVTFARWIAASVVAFVVFLATTHIVLHLPHARTRQASPKGHEDARTAHAAARPTSTASIAGAPHGAAIAAGFILLLVIVALTRTAGSTTFVVGDDRDLLDASDNVILGEVESVRDQAADDRIDRLARVRVIGNLKGALPSYVAVRLDGGQIEGRRHVVFGAADLSRGERVVLFLRQRSDGTFTTAQMALGKFSVVGDGRGALAVRDLHGAAVLRAGAGGLVRRRTWDIRQLGELEASLRAGGTSTTASPEPSSLPPGYRADFTMLSSPPARWYDADDGLAILYQVEASSGASGAVDATWALHQATEAWSRVDCSTAHPSASGEAVPAPFQACDGRSQILFDDPLDELDQPVHCSGVVGVGGFCSVSGDRVVDGTVYDRITEGDVVLNRGFEGCPSWNDVNVSEILTHELGHTLGLGHSSNDPNETDGRLSDAVMYFRAHMDGRGAVVMQDDRDGICTLYPREALRDADGDGVPDGIDDCPTLADPAQADHDSDGIGDLCDPLTMGPGMLGPTAAGSNGSRIKISALLRPAAPIDLTRETLTLSLLAGRAVVHQLVVAPDAWSWSNGAAAAAQWRQGTRRESIQIQLQSDGSYKLRLRGRGVDMGRMLTSTATVRIEVGAYTGAGVLRGGGASRR